MEKIEDVSSRMLYAGCLSCRSVGSVNTSTERHRDSAVENEQLKAYLILYG